MGRDTDRTFRLPPLACAAFAAAALAALLFFASPGRTASVAAETGAPDLEGIRSLVSRTLLASGVPTGPETGASDMPAAAGLPVWTGTLARGELGLSDLLLRCFTGTRYLIAGAEDATFVEAVFASVLERMPTADERSASLLALSEGGGRIAFLDDFLALGDVSSRCAALGIRPGGIPPDALAAATGAGSVPPIAASSTVRLPENGGYAFGRLGSEGTVGFAGLAGRVDFLVDGRVTNEFLSGNAPSAADAGPSSYRVDWNADLESPGLHEAAVLARRADGRGLLIDGGSFRVPVLRDLAAGTLLAGGFLEGGTDDFYRIDAQGGLTSLHAAYPTAPISLAVFMRAGEPLDASHATGSRFLSIRFRTEAGETVYVQATRGGEASGGSDGSLPPYHAVLDADAALVEAYAGRITLRASPGSGAAATGSLDDGAVAALTGEGTDPDGDLWYRLRTEDGAEGYAYSGSVRPLRFEGRLETLALSSPGGGTVRLSPAFDAETLDYGLVLEPMADRLDLSFLAREGVLADAQAALLDAVGNPVPIADGSGFPVPPGSSVLRIRIAAAGRTAEREYRVHLLRPPDPDGFTTTLDAFPTSYRSALWLLHALHPTWTFVAFDPGVPFDAFFAAEAEKARCLVPEGQVPDSFVEPGSPVYDGTTWKAASDAAIAHFIDPRNFLAETDLFQFERLNYLDGVHTPDGVAAIFGSSFFADPVVDTDGATLSFADLFCEAGRESGTSPYFLAARALQEMGRTGTELAHGTLPGYEGLFNHFNIGSTPNPSVENGARINGAEFARWGWLADQQELTDAEKTLLLPWTSRSLSIRGAALYIASGYIGVGQDTQYLQKFDLIAAGGYFNHQYMQNLLAPRNEGRNQYRAYRRTGLLDTPFVFRIPVFTGMPEDPAAEPD